MRMKIAAFALMTALAAPAMAQDAEQPQGTYAFDPHHAQAVFTYDHMGYSTSFGVVNQMTGEVTLDPADPSKSTVTASFPLNTIRTISPDLDAHLASGDFFGTDQGEVTFVSTAVEPTGDRTANVTGDLTINGHTQPVVLEMTLNNAGFNEVEQKPAVGFTGKTTILRSDFGVGGFAPAVSDELQIELNVEALKG